MNLCERRETADTCLLCYFILLFVFLKTFFHTKSVINDLCLLSGAFGYIA